MCATDGIIHHVDRKRVAGPVDEKASFPDHAAAFGRSRLSGLRRKFSFDELLKVSLY